MRIDSFCRLRGLKTKPNMNNEDKFLKNFMLQPNVEALWPCKLESLAYHAHKTNLDQKKSTMASCSYIQFEELIRLPMQWQNQNHNHQERLVEVWKPSTMLWSIERYGTWVPLPRRSYGELMWGLYRIMGSPHFRLAFGDGSPEILHHTIILYMITQAARLGRAIARTIRSKRSGWSVLNHDPSDTNMSFHYLVSTLEIEAFLGLKRSSSASN